MKLLFLGTGPFAVPALRALHAGPHEVVQVICRPPRGRRKEPPAPVRAAAEELGLPVWMPESANLPDSIDRLTELSADLMVVCDYGEILKDTALATTRLSGINLHGSLLPRYRGAAPVQWAVLNGDKVSGNTVIQMTPGLDAGPVVGQQQLAIDPDETAGELEQRLSLVGAELVVEVVDKLAAGTAEGTPQDKSQATKAPRLQKSDGQIDWSRPAARIKNQVRGLQPWPRTYTFWQRGEGEPQRLNIDRVDVVEESSDGSPGEVIASDGQLLVATGDGVLAVRDVQPAGKRRMSAEDWLRGAPIRPGDRFVVPLSES